ncbi:hypothetical protein D3C86_1804960 [compost metagenome]
MRRQPTLEPQALAHSDLAEQHVTEHFMRQAAGEQTFAGLLPIERDQLPEAPGLLRVIEEGAFT